MKINFEYHEVAASQRLEGFVAERLNKIETKYDSIISGDVYFKKENSSNPEIGKICSVRLSMPGTTIFAESSTASFEASVAKVTTELRSQLQKRKEKLKAH
ncbi:ribosome-associated translation inhibitor RaiA [Aequorivita sp. F47161]|jgi:putative sigma-54 modulation protein|uniref:Ribosome-associated translation inhibitor RaiA n=1 Tax=Aequorivita vitellina TaxID=2874475 RepID=A0A9X1QXT7_9FLAO|nr:ribosome-associated translation inhibitor RaiA [Aequorivita vitellina]MCG2419068.1 ribosome-associated translation inhibitor RaiA [Aequorivita vitellina]MCZ4319780.1 ribosome-associated translation inhibitor RaiA [Aequorivita viscosa]